MLVTLRVLRRNKVKLVRQISILGFFSLTGIEYLFSCEIWLQLWFSCFSLRSPWSNSYDPPLDDGAVPSDRLRKLEVDANTAFDQYREM